MAPQKHGGALTASCAGAVLKKGCEGHLRRAKQAHPATCADVGSAALRDLGYDDYNA